MKVSQKEAVFNAVTSTVEIDGTQVSLSKAQRNEVVELLVKGFEADEIQLGSAQENIRKYTGGLLNNWLRKDTRLNGGDKYQTKNPGSRTGSQDDVVKNLRLLMKSGTLSDSQKAQVQQSIKDRIVLLKPKKDVEVDMSLIPEDIKAKLGL